MTQLYENVNESEGHYAELKKIDVKECHLYEVQEQEKLSYDFESRNNGYLSGRVLGKEFEEIFRGDRNVL